MTKIRKQNLSKGKHLKEPSISVDTDTQHPIFSFRWLQSDYGIDTCSGVQISSFVRQLNQVSQLTWRNWKLAPKQGIGLEKIDRTSIRTKIPKQITDDIQSFLVFRFSNGRCVGYRDAVTFYIVWIDGSFKLYNH